MLNNDEELREKINDFLRRKEAKFPELGSPLSRDEAEKDKFKPSFRGTHIWAGHAR